MLTRLSLRFLAMMVLTAVATVSLITMFEAMIRAPLSFGMAIVVVLPLLIGARSCGAAVVAQAAQAASLRQIAGYGLWCAALGLIVLAAGIMALQVARHGDLRAALALLTNRPSASLILLALAYATCALITCTGFALGARAQARLLPQP